MADMDDTQEQEKKGGGLAGVTVGTGTGILAGAGAAQLIKPEKAKEALATAKTAETTAVKAYDDAVEGLKKTHEKVFNDATAAENLQVKTAKDYNNLVSDKWNDAIKADGVKPETAKELRISGLTAQKEVISKLPEMSAEAKALATRGVDAQIADLKLPETKDIQASLTSSWDKAMEAAKTEAVAAAEKKEAGTGVKALADFQGLHAQVESRMAADVVKSEPVSKAFATAAKASKDEGIKTVEATIAAHPDVIAAEATMKGTKTAEAEAAKSAWSKIVEDGTKEKLKPAKETAVKAVESATARVEATEAGFLKKPFKLAFKGSNGEKAAVIITALAAATAAYMGVKAYKNRGRSESYVEQITQERAAAPTPDQSAAAAR